jgi:hypothetical protein
MYAGSATEVLTGKLLGRPHHPCKISMTTALSLTYATVYSFACNSNHCLACLGAGLQKVQVQQVQHTQTGRYSILCGCLNLLESWLQQCIHSFCMMFMYD